MIELKGLQKKYGERTAVEDLTLTFPAGKITALLGPSGCGKTTTLRMINRLIEPTAGSISLNGQNVLGIRPEVLRRNMGYVIQRIGLFPHLTIGQNVATVPDLLKQDRKQTRQKVDELLQLVGLDPDLFRDKKPAELSGGQQQRVGVARALAADPPVLLMDEPFGALDPIAREKLQLEFLDIQKRLSKTIVMVTHDISEAILMADCIALMNEGRLEQFGTPDELIHQPASPFVRRFMGEDAVLTQLAGISLAELVKPGHLEGAPVLSSSDHARLALSVMLRDGVDAVAVQDHSGVLGVVHYSDLLHLQRSQK
ncbi:ABC transporter ATP-binding protein [Deinococcus cellulosilyticus]|uniref:ABC transporter ATP-binding protein n=1 Tax=Deinococcus cellulosilyticus (strain DSM 18568 / NBRC 106333 / KACC 11606 / 5516J-15) TaxID=1223518 RepID=A0A511N1I4_DEIC1|nr:ABC transporter ATP-binding protein [Deinococcus cellulosilyticus]GEM46750.1 ABC transporter ATP-binding protein [Deinococcus cellulosilyticus NBRC 106333 = KACC 11606]